MQVGMKLGKSLTYTGKFLKLTIVLKADLTTRIVSTHQEVPTKYKLIPKRNRKRTKHRNTPFKIDLLMVTYKIQTSLFNRTIIITKILLALKITKTKLIATIINFRSAVKTRNKGIISLEAQKEEA